MHAVGRDHPAAAEDELGHRAVSAQNRRSRLRRPGAGSPRWNGDRRSARSRLQDLRRIVDRAPSASAPSVAGTRTTVGATLPNAIRGAGAPTAAITILEMACAARVPDLPEPLAPSTGGDLDRHDQLVGPTHGLAVSGVKLVERHAALAGGAAQHDDRSAAASTGRVSPAGEALAMLPPRVPRFWICIPPDSRARPRPASEAAGTSARADERGIGREGADRERVTLRIAISRSSSSAQMSRNRRGSSVPKLSAT